MMLLYEKLFSNGDMYGMGLIRTLLAVSVVIAHSSLFLGFNIANGMVAVQVFYIFSGFYMFMILTERYKFTYKFYKSRALRLYPTYLIVALIALFVWIGKGEYLDTWNAFGYLEKIFFIFSNTTMFFQDIVMFLAVNPEAGSLFFTASFSQESMPAYKLLIVPQAWTLGVELTFYLFVPFFVRRKTLTLFAIAFASLTFRFVMFKKGFLSDPWSYRFFPFELALFLFGGLGYRAYSRWKNSSILEKFAPAVTLIALLSLIGFQLLPIAGYIKRLFLFYTLIAMAMPFIFHASRSNKTDRFLGELSYPIYITHHIIATSFYLLFEQYSLLLYEKQLLCIPVIALSLAASIAINKYIQQPIDSFRRC